MDDAQFMELKAELLVVEKLLALNIVKEMRFRKDQVMALSSLGFKAPKIAELLGTTANVVRAHISGARKKKTRKILKKAD